MYTCCAGGTWYVDLDEKEMEKALGVNLNHDIVTCEVPFGGILFLNNAIPHRSLENYSNKVRWSVDLRWQNPNRSPGFYGLKECVTMRKADDPNYQIDWENFANLDRTVLQEKEVGQANEDEFDATIYGPWMRRWKIVNHNRHTDALKRMEAQEAMN